LLSLGLGIVLSLTFGHLSDKVGRIRIMLPASVLALISLYPAFALLVHYKSVPVLLLALVWFALLQAATSTGPAYALTSEMFPTQIRSTGMSLSYNGGSLTFNAFAPIAFTSLIGITGSAVAPSFYLTGTTLVTMLSLIVLWHKLGFR